MHAIIVVRYRRFVTSQTKRVEDTRDQMERGVDVKRIRRNDVALGI
jgi:hypothetical protein